MLVLITDSREQDKLVFPKTEGIAHRESGLTVGDYGALVHGEALKVVVERKSIPDIFSSFSSGYEAEKNKILKAKALGIKYIIAIEGTVLRVLRGHTYWNGKEDITHPKSGIAQLRQLLTISIKYQTEIWYCSTREEMALRIQEYFLRWAKTSSSKESSRTTAQRDKLSSS